MANIFNMVAYKQSSGGAGTSPDSQQIYFLLDKGQPTIITGVTINTVDYYEGFAPDYIDGTNAWCSAFLADISDTQLTYGAESPQSQTSMEVIVEYENTGDGVVLTLSSDGDSDYFVFGIPNPNYN